MIFTLTDVVGFTSSDLGSLFALVFVLIALVQGVLLRILSLCGCTELHMLLLAQSVRVVAYSTYSMLDMFPFKWVVFVLETLESITTVWEPAFTSLLTKGLDEDRGFV